MKKYKIITIILAVALLTSSVINMYTCTRLHTTKTSLERRLFGRVQGLYYDASILDSEEYVNSESMLYYLDIALDEIETYSDITDSQETLINIQSLFESYKSIFGIARLYGYIDEVKELNKRFIEYLERFMLPEEEYINIPESDPQKAQKYIEKENEMRKNFISNVKKMNSDINYEWLSRAEGGLETSFVDSISTALRLGSIVQEKGYLEKTK